MITVRSDVESYKYNEKSKSLEPVTKHKFECNASEKDTLNNDNNCIAKYGKINENDELTVNSSLGTSNYVYVDGLWARSSTGSSSSSGDIDVTNFASQGDITELWNALGTLATSVDILADKLTNTTTSDSDQPVLDGPGLME